jgi:hypothetical protein
MPGTGRAIPNGAPGAAAAKAAPAAQAETDALGAREAGPGEGPRRLEPRRDTLRGAPEAPGKGTGADPASGPANGGGRPHRLGRCAPDGGRASLPRRPAWPGRAASASSLPSPPGTGVPDCGSRLAPPSVPAAAPAEGVASTTGPRRRGMPSAGAGQGGRWQGRGLGRAARRGPGGPAAPMGARPQGIPATRPARASGPDLPASCGPPMPRGPRCQPAGSAWARSRTASTAPSRAGRPRPPPTPRWPTPCPRRPWPPRRPEGAAVLRPVVFCQDEVSRRDCGGNPGPRQDREEHADVQQGAEKEGHRDLRQVRP